MEILRNKNFIFQNTIKSHISSWTDTKDPIEILKWGVEPKKLRQASRKGQKRGMRQVDHIFKVVAYEEGPSFMGEVKSGSNHKEGNTS